MSNKSKRIDSNRSKAQVGAAIGGRVSDLTASQWRELAMVVAPLLALVAGAFFLAYQFVEPAPPRKLTMTTGSETGAYHRFAQRYAEHLKGQASS